jgi:uncharacterized ubiquitin-like protein YukD
MSSLITAASQKGSALLAEIRKRYPNYHPILAIVDIAHDKDCPLDLQFNCHKTVAKYIEPELKSIEVKGDFRETHTVRVSLFDSSNAEDAEFVEYGTASLPAQAEYADVP